MVGIFGSYDFNLLEKPEDAFKKKLDQNPIHPFKEIEPNVYEFRTKSIGFGLCIMTILVTIATALGMYSNAPVDENIFYHIGILIAASANAWATHEERRLILNGDTNQYEFYKGNRLIYKGHYHNIYVRLNGIKSGGGEMFFSMVVGGYMAEEQGLCVHSTGMVKLRRLGRRLAHRLNLNYFDYQDVSRHHIIRHKCPYMPSKTKYPI